MLGRGEVKIGSHSQQTPRTSKNQDQGYIRLACERHPIFTSPRPSMVSPTPQLILHWSFANPIILLTPPSVDLSKEDHHQHEEKKKSEQSSSFILSVEHIRNFQSRK